VSFILDGFYCREFAFLNPIYKLPWATLLVYDFIYLIIKESTLGFFDRGFEVLPIF